MRHNAEHHSRPRSAARAAFFKTTQALITAAILIGSVLGVCEMAWAQGQPIIFSVIGDVPYGTNEKADFQQHMDNHDLYSPVGIPRSCRRHQIRRQCVRRVLVSRHGDELAVLVGPRVHHPR